MVAPQLIGQIEIISTNLINPKNLVALLYLGIVGTGTVTWLQAKAWSRIAAFEGGLIQTLEPVFGSIYAFFLPGETFSMRGYVGAVMVIVGTIVAPRQRKADARSRSRDRAGGSNVKDSGQKNN